MKNRDCLILARWSGDESLVLLDIPGVRDLVSEYLIEAYYNQTFSKLYLDFLTVEVTALIEEDNQDSPMPVSLETLDLGRYFDDLLNLVQFLVGFKIQQDQRLIHIHFARHYIIFELMGINNDHLRPKRRTIWKNAKRGFSQAA